jgi:hypothetical protein
VTPTRPSTLLLTALVTGLLAYLLARLVYGDLPPLPGFAPLPLVLLALFELGLARAVRHRTAERTRGRGLHPMQVARAAVLAKASSAAGALLVGLYAGLLVHLLVEQTDQARKDALVGGASLVACLLLVVAALLLERACRTPDEPS